MKVLVAYYSETGNTEKIARAIYEEVLKEHEAHLKKIKEVTADTLNSYDLVFLGSACHSADLTAPVKRILEALPKSPRFKLAGSSLTRFHALKTAPEHAICSIDGQVNA